MGWFSDRVCARLCEGHREAAEKAKPTPRPMRLVVVAVSSSRHAGGDRGFVYLKPRGDHPVYPRTGDGEMWAWAEGPLAGAVPGDEFAIIRAYPEPEEEI